MGKLHREHESRELAKSLTPSDLDQIEAHQEDVDPFEGPELKWIEFGALVILAREAMTLRADVAELLAVAPQCDQRLSSGGRCQQRATRTASSKFAFPRACDECAAPHLDDLKDLPFAATIRRLEKA